jgi:DNA-binding transcriptional regulator YiaG
MEITISPQKIRQARITSGLKQRECAALVGIKLRTWQSWEQGEHKINPAAWELFCIKIEQIKTVEYS